MLYSMKKETRTDWQERVKRVLLLLAGSLDTPPDLEQAAGEAASSPWHFHRAFKTITGESFSAALRRLRLERAAYSIKAGSTVIDAALEAGFESPESFCRVFTRKFGLNPSRVAKLPWWSGELEAPNGLHYRTDNKNLWFFPGTSNSREEICTRNSTRIVNMKSMQISALSGEGDFWQLPALWEQFSARLTEAGHGFGPGKMLTVFEGETLFRTAVILEADAQCPAGTEELRLPGGSYAVTVFMGSTEGIGPFWEQLRNRFFPASGWYLDPGRPSLEWYQNYPPPGIPELALTFLCDPVLPG